ncbi:MAG: DUF448 domain-containing protein [Sphingomonas sp.]|nr:MAG: DUF448 domain-containing protein [Sphingomonas sp.]
MSSNDTPDATVEVGISAGARPDRSAPERKCILSGVHGERASLIRLALGPDGAAWPDLAAKLPGRGAWVAADRALLETAQAKGKLKGALARAFRQPVDVPDDLARRIADGLERRALDRLGLEHRAGHLIFGSEKISEWARGGRVFLLMHAADAAEDGKSKLNQAFRAGEGDMADVLTLPAGRDALSRSLGRENIVHSGVTNGKAAARIATEVARWAAFLGTSSISNDDRGLPERRNDEGRE